MGNPILAVLPYAMGAAISPFVLTVQVLILSSSRQPRLRGWMYTLGGAAFVAIFIIALTAGMRNVTLKDASQSPVMRIVEVSLALLLIALAIRTYLRKSTPGDKSAGRVAEVMQTGKPWVFFLIGLGVMASNLSSLIIIIPGVHEVQTSAAGFPLDVLALLLLAFFTLLPCLIPVGLVTVLGHRADGFLAALNDFVTKNNRLITAIIALVLAAYLLYDAFK